MLIPVVEVGGDQGVHADGTIHGPEPVPEPAPPKPVPVPVPVPVPEPAPTPIRDAPLTPITNLVVGKTPGAATIDGLPAPAMDDFVGACRWDKTSIGKCDNGTPKELVCQGELFIEAMNEYHQARVPLNPVKPMGFVFPSTADDVANWMVCAKRAGIPYRIRNGGHSYELRSAVNNGIVIDVRKFSKMELSADGTHATIEGGQMLGSIYAFLGNAGKLLPMGVGASVGISGLTMGGGAGAVMRMYGPTCDSVLSAKVVLSNGKIIDHEEMVKDHKDLLWALSGGGPFYAVVLEWKFAIHKAPDTVVTYELQAKLDQSTAIECLKAYRAWKPWTTLGKEYAFVELAMGYGKVTVKVFYTGKKSDFETNEMPAMTKAFKFVAFDPKKTLCEENTWTNHYLKFTNLADQSKINPLSLEFEDLVKSRSNKDTHRNMAATSLMLQEKHLDDKAITALVDFVMADGAKGFVQVHALGAEAAAIKDNAWTYREAHMECQIYDESTPVRTAAVEKIHELPCVGYFYNHMNEKLDIDKYFGASVSKLKAVKRMYDGNNQIMGAHSIKPSDVSVVTPTVVGVPSTAGAAMDVCKESTALAKNVYTFWAATQAASDGHFFMNVGATSTQANDIQGVLLIPQSRHLWFFSMYANVFSDAVAKEKAQKLFAYLEENKPASGGFKTSISDPTSGINLMATGFALYGIATYAQHVASPAEKSAVLAILKETYTSVEYLYNKDVGAYEGEGAMTYDRPGDVEKYVSANLLMHMIEALTPMCLVAPAVTEYKERLSRLVDFVFNKLYVTTGGGFLTDYAFTGYDNKDVSYGHNAQMVYILETALAALNLPVTTYTAKLAGMCLTMDKGFVAVGTDDKMGYVKERATSTVVVWWVQAEALLGYAWLAINGGEAAATGKKRFLHVWAFVQKHFVDSVNGEWWDTLDTVDYTRSSDIKGHAWKSSYHTGRCAFILKEYCTKLAAVLAA